MNMTSLLRNYFCLPSYTKNTKIEGHKKTSLKSLGKFGARIDGIILVTISAFKVTKRHPKDGLGKMENRRGSFSVSDCLLFLSASCGIVSSLRMNFKTGTNVPGDADNVSAVTGLGIGSCSSEER
jgi:hypothetical protein